MAYIIHDYRYAADLIRRGDMVAIPTETVYGLAANAHCSQAIERVYQLKQRSYLKNLALNVHPAWDIDTWCHNIPSYISLLRHAFWPGPLTLVLPLKTAAVLPVLIGPGHSIALRCPAHELSLKLLDHLGHPIVAPSANPSTQLSATSAVQVVDYFKTCDVAVLDGGACQLGLESTILQIVDEQHCEVLRHGAISAAEIANCIGFAPQDANVQLELKASSRLYYFSTDEELFSLQAQVGDNFAVIAEPKICERLCEAQLRLVLPISEFEIQQHFYALCHQALQTNCDYIFLQLSPQLQHLGLRNLIRKIANPCASLQNRVMIS